MIPIEIHHFSDRARDLLLREEDLARSRPPALLWSLALLPLRHFERLLLHAGAVTVSSVIRASLSPVAARRHRDALGEDLYRFALFNAPLIAPPDVACVINIQAGITRTAVLNAGAALVTGYSSRFPGQLARRIEAKAGVLAPACEPNYRPGTEGLLQRLLKKLEPSWQQRVAQLDEADI